MKRRKLPLLDLGCSCPPDHWHHTLKYRLGQLVRSYADDGRIHRIVGLTDRHEGAPVSDWTYYTQPVEILTDGVTEEYQKDNCCHPSFDWHHAGIPDDCDIEAL